MDFTSDAIPAKAFDICQVVEATGVKAHTTFHKQLHAELRLIVIADVSLSKLQTSSWRYRTERQTNG